jgi:hypothetical protein
MDLLRENSLSIRNRREILSGFESITDTQTQNSPSEIRRQVVRFDVEKGSEKQWVEHIAFNVLLPLFKKFVNTVIPPNLHQLLALYRPLDLCNANIDKTFAYFEKVSNNCAIN